MELVRVLAYPKFNLSVLEQKELLADLLRFAEVIRLPSPWPDLALCIQDSRPKQYSYAVVNAIP
jgi:hypothetical protein